MTSNDRDKNTYELIEELRQLRLDARRLNSTLVKRLHPFQKSDGSFKTLPIPDDKAKNETEISVAATCTVLMAAMGVGKAAIDADKTDKLFNKEEIAGIIDKIIVNSKWGSSGLVDGNAFTTAIVVRCAGLVVESKIMGREVVTTLRHKNFKDNDGVGDKTLVEIVQEKASSPEKSFAVPDYPAKTTHAYWFVDGAMLLGIELKPKTWQGIATWASNEFRRQLTYVSAGNDALMDPPSLAMAACVVKKIREFIEKSPESTEMSAMLPSTTELNFGIQQVFAKQSDSGIWPRYFPLFHFPTGLGAADYCFSFEFLEAILIEFGTSVLRDLELLRKLKRTISWCDTNELVFTNSMGTYRGWNSGGEIRSLEAGKSESWATATVHMFLTQLERRINDLLDELVLRRFGLDRKAAIKSTKTFEDLIDVDVVFRDEAPTTLKDVIQTEILQIAEGITPERLFREELSTPRSALLFGPPGTSKSRLATSIAEYLGWPLVVLTPSEFLGKGVDQVHSEVNERFRDLMDLRAAVVFFDEMDALAQTRESDVLENTGNNPKPTQDEPQPPLSSGRGGGALDVTRQLLTTSMLPKLTSLWDQKHVIFLMATNHKQNLDPAITRPNRFDLLLCVAPPPWSRTCSEHSLGKILKVPDAQIVKAELLRLAPLNSDAAKHLDRFTVAEIGIFLDHLRRRKNSSSVYGALLQFANGSEFGQLVADWAETNITLKPESATLAEFLGDAEGSRRQYYRFDSSKPNGPEPPPANKG